MRYVVTAPFHISPVDQVGASTGDDVAAADVHSDAHHPVRGHTAAGRGHHRGDVASTALRVKVVASTALPVQLSFGVVGVGRSAGKGGGDQVRTRVGFILRVQKSEDSNSYIVPLVYTVSPPSPTYWT